MKTEILYENREELFGQGPWLDEPDRAEWRMEGGFVGLAVRVDTTGAWCGYIGVPPGHPWHGKGSDDVDASVHGGLTYAGACAGRICHVPEPGESDDVFWLGFDCAHGGDVMPAIVKLVSSGFHEDGPFPVRYRDLAYVRREVESLAEQARAAARAP